MPPDPLFVQADIASPSWAEPLKVNLISWNGKQNVEPIVVQLTWKAKEEENFAKSTEVHAVVSR